MSAEERYIDSVMRRIWASPERRERLETDLRAHFSQASQAGEAPASVAARLGEPAAVADEFMKSEDLLYAGFFERVFAFVADIGVIATLWLPLMLLCVAMAPWLEAQDGASDVEISIVLVILTIGSMVVALIGIAIFYFPVLEKRFGKTPGKHLMRLRVRDESGAEISWGQAFLRRISLYFEILVLDAVFVPFTKRKQRAFDIVAETLVLREPGGSFGPARYLKCLLVWLPTVLTILLAVSVIALGNQ